MSEKRVSNLGAVAANVSAPKKPAFRVGDRVRYRAELREHVGQVRAFDAATSRYEIRLAEMLVEKTELQGVLSVGNLVHWVVSGRTEEGIVERLLHNESKVAICVVRRNVREDHLTLIDRDDFGRDDELRVSPAAAAWTQSSASDAPAAETAEKLQGVINNWHIKSDGCIHVHESYAGSGARSSSASVNDGIVGHTSKVVRRDGRTVCTQNSVYNLGKIDPTIAAVLATMGCEHRESDPLRSVEYLLHAKRITYGDASTAAKLAHLAIANLKTALQIPGAQAVFERIEAELRLLGIDANTC